MTTIIIVVYLNVVVVKVAVVVAAMSRTVVVSIARPIALTVPWSIGVVIAWSVVAGVVRSVNRISRFLSRPGLLNVLLGFLSATIVLTTRTLSTRRVA